MRFEVLRLEKKMGYGSSGSWGWRRVEGEAEGTDRDRCASFGECGGRQVMVKGRGWSG